MKRQRLQNHKLLNNLILMTICSAYCMISLSFVLKVQHASYFLFLCIAFSLCSFGILMYTEKSILTNIALLFSFVTMGHYLIFSGTVKLVDSLIVISVVFFAVVTYTVQFSKRNFEALILGAVICSLMLILKMGDSQYYTYQGWLMYVYNNSNTAGVIALNLFVIMMLGSKYIKKKYLRFSLWTISAFMLNVILKTSSRACFFSAILYVILLMLEKRRRLLHAVERILLLSPILLIPIITVFISLWFSHDLVVLGKPLFSGRDYMWLDAVSTVFNNFIRLRNDYTSGLNTAFKLSYLSGMFGVVLFFLLFQKIISNARKNMGGVASGANLAILAVGVVFLNQSFESVLVSGSYAVCYLTMAMFGLAKIGRTP